MLIGKNLNPPFILSHKKLFDLVSMAGGFLYLLTEFPVNLALVISCFVVSATCITLITSRQTLMAD